MKYQSFNTSVYCPVGNLIDITDFDDFDQKLNHIYKNVKVGKVYLETYRGGTFISKSQMEKVISYFQSKGIEVSGGITTDDVYNGDGGFSPFCYSSKRTRDILTKVVTLTAELFDEFILDDFYFTNCRCEECLKQKGDCSFTQFRLEQMKEISENVIVGTAKQVNPKIHPIIKYPNWYEHYQDAGYNLADEPQIFDYIYTGTETRNPTYTAQHLPKYLSYFIMRYLENVAPDRNLGGWFDPYECTYNLTSYMEQGYLTLFAKAKEAMLFSLGSLFEDKAFLSFAPAIGQAFTDVDAYLNQLGRPVGTACYLPYHSHGEDYLHNYLGMCGIPLEPYPEYKEDAATIFLTESASMDPDILYKMKRSLHNGADVIVTSGFVQKLGTAFHDFMHVNYTTRKALINQYAYSKDGGVTYGSCKEAAKPILVPQLEFYTNDVWQLISGFGEDNSFPLLLKTKYDKGRIFVLAIPDDFGNLYHYPRAILTTIRNLFMKNFNVTIDSISKVALFTYDNDTLILRNFNPFIENIKVIVKTVNATLYDIERKRVITGETTNKQTVFSLTLIPGINLVLKICQDGERDS